MPAPSDHATLQTRAVALTGPGSDGAGSEVPGPRAGGLARPRSRSAGPGEERSGYGGPANSQTLRRHNLALVLGAIAQHDRATRAQISGRTGLTKAAVSSLVEALVAARLVVAGAPDRGLVGRPGSPLGLDPSGPAGLGVEINVDYFSVCLVDFAGTPRHERTVTGDIRRRSAHEVLRLVARAVRHVLEDAQRCGLAVAGLSVAVPGVVDLDGVLRRAPNLPGWEGLAVAERLCAELGRPVHAVGCENEANVAALAELWFAGRACTRDFVRVSGRIGVGAGIVIGGEIWRGSSGLSGELGHTMVEPDGRTCACGARGCLEQVAGQDALLRDIGASADEMTALGGPDGPARELVRRASAGDDTTLAVLGRAGSALGVALASLVNLVGVPTVVLGGLYRELAPWLAEPLVAELHARVLSHAWAPVEVSVSPLAGSAAVRGAAGAVVREILADPAAWFPDMLATSRAADRLAGD